MSLGGYVASFVAGIATDYVRQFLQPKIKIRYCMSHSFMYTIPVNPNPALPAANPPENQPANQPAQPAVVYLLTQSVTIQNFGRVRAPWVEIVHQQRPDFFQLNPALNFTENVNAHGQHVLKVESLAPKEFFVIQFLSYTHMPALLFIRSPEGHASPMPWMVVRKLPRWVFALGWLAMLVGIGSCVYWIIKGGIFLLKSVGAL